jgi:hypothetical protein
VHCQFDIAADLGSRGDTRNHPALALRQLIEAGREQLLGQSAYLPAFSLACGLGIWALCPF